MSILAKNLNGFLARIAVAPFAGAWIEIGHSQPAVANSPSLPLRERGLKSHSFIAKSRIA